MISDSRTLAERLEDVTARLEAMAARPEGLRQSGTEQLVFRGSCPVLLSNGLVKAHSWSKLLPIEWHRDDDPCSVLTVEEFRYREANPIALAGAS